MRSLLQSTLAAALVVMAAGQAKSDLIAGWDFSQYFGTTVLSIDAETFTDTLTANYSSFDPTFGAGIESAAFGKMYLNGEFGSTAQPIGTGIETFIPVSLSNSANCDALNPCDNFGVVGSEGGQQFTELLRMVALAAVSVTFEADLRSVPEFGTDWALSFDGILFDDNGSGGGNGATDIDFFVSTDGVNFAPVGTRTVTDNEAAFNVPLTSEAADRLFVRFDFAQPERGIRSPRIDNVAITATTVIPEPGTALLLGTGLFGLVAAGRRRA